MEVSSYHFPPLFSFIVQKLPVSGSVMNVCCSSALEEPAVSVEPVAVLKPSKASPKPLCVGAELLQGSGQLRQRGSCGHWCCEPGKRVCIMIHLWLGLLPRKMSVWGICHLFGLEY